MDSNFFLKKELGQLLAVRFQFFFKFVSADEPYTNIP